ncbi:hypothetical protein [Streptomyces chrestomyceticus]|uniref:hypothetical protein n=1 Tax=Streptomyces chrestomyceticus TaxID=68185 RepID=UPI003798E40B
MNGSISHSTGACGPLQWARAGKEGIVHALLALDLAEGLPPCRGPALQERSRQ